MTNRKFKDYQKNKLLYDIMLDNLKMLCIIMLSLNKHFPKLFYRLNIQKWLEEQADWCELMNEYEECDAYDFKMQNFCEKYGVDDDTAMKIVKKHLNTYHEKNMIVLRENVKLALVHTAFDFGFGKVRLEKLTSALLNEEYPNWQKDVARFGIEIEKELQNVDWRKLKPKKERLTSIQEQKEAAKKLAEYRAYFEYVMSKEEEECL